MKTANKKSNVISMSLDSRARINKVAELIKGKDLFTDKIVLAKKTLSELKSLPI